MYRRFFRGALVASALLMAMPVAVSARVAASESGPAPGVADLLAPPAIEDPQLSPDGARVAARVAIAGVARLALFDAAHPGPPQPVTLPAGERLEWYCWLDGRRLLTSLIRDGDAPTTRLVVFDVPAGAQTQLGEARAAGMGDQVLHVDRARGFLLLESHAPGADTPAVYRVDLVTGARNEVVRAEAFVHDWVADSAGVVRAGMGARGDRSWLLYRRGEGDRFSRSTKGAGDADSGIEQFFPVQGSDKGFALAETPHGHTGLYAYDFRKSRLGALLYENPDADVADFEASPDGRLLGVGWSGAREEMLWFDPSRAHRQAAIDAALPGRVNRVVSASADGTLLLVLSRSASDPGAWYVFAHGRATELAAINPALAGKHMAEVRPIRYRARDGLSIPGYLTLPPGRDPHGLPLIVMPHGGPFARDEWDYDPWVQYLATRGYAVLQPNFRGSTGYGREFLDRGDGEWGRGMQDDADDGVKWLAARGTIDPGRVCIMGASYGGYAAMWAAARDAGTYRCAIAFAGISDVRAQLDYDHKTFDERDFRAWRRRIQGDAPSLESLSPMTFVGGLRMPILIAHGTADETVPPDQSVRLHEALTRLGRAHDYVAYPGEGHSLEDPADSVDFLNRVGRFLAAHNPS